MSLFNFLVNLNYFIYPNQASYITIHPGLIRMTNKLSYFQTENCDHLIWKWDSFFILTHRKFIQLPGDSLLLIRIQIKLLTSLFIMVWLEWRKSCHIPKQENWDHVIWKWDSFFILTPMSLLNSLVSLHYFMYPNKASYIAIHPGLIRMTNKLSFSQTEKLGSPDLKVG